MIPHKRLSPSNSIGINLLSHKRPHWLTMVLSLVPSVSAFQTMAMYLSFVLKLLTIYTLPLHLIRLLMGWMLKMLKFLAQVSKSLSLTPTSNWRLQNSIPTLNTMLTLLVGVLIRDTLISWTLMKLSKLPSSLILRLYVKPIKNDA